MGKPTYLLCEDWLGDQIALCKRALKRVFKVYASPSAIEVLESKALHRERFRRDVRAALQGALLANHYGDRSSEYRQGADAPYKITVYRSRKSPVGVDSELIEKPSVPSLA